MGTQVQWRLLLGVIVGCDDGLADAKLTGMQILRKSPTMPGVPNSYQRKSFKGSHNSYQRKEDIFTQVAWDGLKPAEGGFRALEFDINRHSDGSGGASDSYFQINHKPGGSGTTLATWLSPLLSIHVRDQGHEPFFVTLDIKSTEGDPTKLIVTELPY